MNILHPIPPAETEALLRLVASVPYWTVLHYGAMFTVAMGVAGVALLVRTLDDAPARAGGT